MNLTVSPSAPLRGTLTLPGDKSLSHRAVIFGSIAQGTTTIENLLESEDVLRTVKIFQQLGVDIKKIKRRSRILWRIKGKGLAALKPSRDVLYCGNSGTTMRLLMGLLAGLPFRSVLTGDDSLNRRPMGRVAQPLRKMGADIHEVIRGKKRLIIIQGKKLAGIHYRSPVASAQVKTAVLLAGLTTGEKIAMTEPSLSRDHSERMLQGFGVSVKRTGLRGVHLGAKRVLHGQRLKIAGDPSSAAFFVVSALINSHRKTRLQLKGVCLNPTRTGFLSVLQRMGAKIKISHRRLLCGEPVGDLTVVPAKLKGTLVKGKIVPHLIDEVPILAVAAACAQGRSRFQNVAELRVKETDRIDTLEKNFRRLGIRFHSKKQSFHCHPEQSEGSHGYRGILRPAFDRTQNDNPTGPKGQGVLLDSFGDHRIAMSLAVLATTLPAPLLIQNVDCINTSFPQFFASLHKIGVKLQIFKRNFL